MNNQGSQTGAAAIKMDKHGRSRVLARRETFSAYMFLLPSLLFFITFVVVPMFLCVYYSLSTTAWPESRALKGWATIHSFSRTTPSRPP